MFEKVLIALPDDEGVAVDLARAGMAIALSHNAEIRLVSVLAPVPSSIAIPSGDVLFSKPVQLSNSVVEAREEKLRASIGDHLQQFNASQTVKIGDPAVEILDEAQSWGADLIIVGARDKDWFLRIFDRSVGQAVTRKADCAVLVLPDLADPS